MVDVSDTGEGISKENLARFLTPSLRQKVSATAPGWVLRSPMGSFKNMGAPSKLKVKMGRALYFLSFSHPLAVNVSELHSKPGPSPLLDL